MYIYTYYVYMYIYIYELRMRAGFCDHKLIMWPVRVDNVATLRRNPEKRSVSWVRFFARKRVSRAKMCVCVCVCVHVVSLFFSLSL